MTCWIGARSQTGASTTSDRRGRGAGITPAPADVGVGGGSGMLARDWCRTRSFAFPPRVREASVDVAAVTVERCTGRKRSLSFERPRSASIVGVVAVGALQTHEFP